MEKIYGYVRVSSRDQNEERQMVALKDFGVDPENIVIEKLSGKDFHRPKFNKLIKKMKTNDILAVKSIDRLGRNYEEILDKWRYLTKERNIAIVVLDMPLLDTRRGKDLTGTLIADIVLQLLSYVAETERTNIRQRQAEGIAIAKEKGIKFGRRKNPVPKNFNKVVAKWRNGEISKNQALEKLGMKHSTFYKIIRERNLIMKPSNEI